MSALANPFSESRPICVLLGGGFAAVRCAQKPEPAVCALFLSPRQLATRDDAGSIDAVSAVPHAIKVDLSVVLDFPRELECAA